ncbi:MAG TPA: ABC transporter permease [Candidatus Angelobacter sp.]|nr:ABC transporter permease [Candidatus Angelobacter sp.]
MAGAERRISLKEPALIALDTLRAHKLRSVLTLLGVILSVSTLIVVVSLIEGTNRYISSRVANFGANVFLIHQYPIVTSLEQFAKLQRRNKVITWEDFEYLHNNMVTAKGVGVEVRRRGVIKYGSESLQDMDVRGVTANIGDMDVEEPATGRYISDGDNEHRSDVVLLGNDVVKRFFLGVEPLGKSILIDGRPFEVVGTAKEIGTTFGQSQDGFVYMPIQTFRKIYGTQASLSINVQSIGPRFMEGTKEEARTLMRARRHLGPKDEDNFGFLEPSSLMDLWNNLTGTLASTSIIIVFVFLIIGGIVIMNIMLASVTERTREIGVRKSLGATRRDVLYQFVIESAVISTIGGIIGILVAATISFVIGAVTPVPMAVPINWVLIAVAVAAVVGIVFGAYPAYRAAKLDPIEALRFEA